ncbi:hypothetical protein [Brucella endophytica]|uniref:hypothetical protein n=1 Tax=Brucella endophytica TaxID=1963359 RepID=UPI00166544E2|nr:hypothetical protein [Brucella endophytica]
MLRILAAPRIVNSAAPPNHKKPASKAWNGSRAEAICQHYPRRNCGDRPDWATHVQNYIKLSGSPI